MNHVLKMIQILMANAVLSNADGGRGLKHLGTPNAWG
jgi:hypothetical protein